MHKRLVILILLVFSNTLFFLGIVYGNTYQIEKNNIEQLKRNNAYLNVDYSKYSCPPVLTKQECHKRIDMCLINGFDVEKYLLQVYNKLK